MENAVPEKQSAFATEPIGRLIVRFAVPSVIALIRADGSPQYAMLSMVIGAIINVILDPVLIFVFHMGVQGAAVATIIGQVASFVVSVVYMPRFKTVHLNASAFSPRAKTCGNTVSGMILLNSA